VPCQLSGHGAGMEGKESRRIMEEHLEKLMKNHLKFILTDNKIYDLSYSKSNAYFEMENDFVNNGILYPFKAHYQTTLGKNLMVGAHYHEHIEILYGIKGRFSIFLDDRIHYFAAGDMVIINSMDVHTMQSYDELENSYIVIRFKPEVLYNTSQTIFEAKYVLPFTMKTSKHQKIFCSEEIAHTELPELIFNILKEDSQRDYGFELAIRTDIGRIFLWVLRNWQKKGLDLNLGAGLNQDTIERLQLVFDYVNNHYDQPITIEDMARLCNMSYSYFSRFFKKTMQRNFSDYVNLIRITKSEYLLSTTDESITDIALSVGFTTASYFIEQFKHFKNMTPKKYRTQFLF